MFWTILLKSIENHCWLFFTLLILIIVLSCIHLSNYIRMCYYVSKLPGPYAHPIIGNANMFSGSLEEITNNIEYLTKTYSPLVRVWLGPVPVLSTIDPNLVEELLSNHKYLEKPRLMKLVGKFMLGDSIIISEVPKWKHNRGIVIRGFSPNNIKAYFKVFVEKVNLLTKQLEMELNNEQPFNIFDYLSKTTLDAACGSTMGVNVNAHEDDSSYFKAMESSWRLLTKRVFNPLFYPEIFYRMTKDYKQLNKDKSIIWGLSTKIITEKIIKNDKVQTKNDNLMVYNNRNKNEHRKPLLDYLIDFTKNNPSFTEKQMETEINLLIMGAYDTSAKALSFVLLNLAANKNIQNKVCEELFQVLGDLNRKQIDFDDLTKLKYMEMVMKESMRLHSTVSMFGREVTQDIHFDNYTIPKGVDVAISVFGLHRNADYWENPLEFDPERFTDENIKKRHPYAYIPFGGGPRNCIGYRYAWILMKTTLATLLSRYEFHTDLDMNALRFEMEITLKLIGGHQVRITPRKR